MKAKEFIPASKPRNFVAKNAQSSGAGRHQDSSKKKDQEQGKVKHKKDLVPMEDVSEVTGAAVRMQRAADRQRTKSDASLARTPSSIPKKEEPKKEGWSDAMVARRTGTPRTPYSVYIKGKKWKDFENDDHAEAVANKLKAKFKADGRDPSVITIAPTEIITGEASALEKFRKAADEREKKHNAAEKEMNARHARGEEDMKGSIDRLEKHLNNK
jgi:hypothetical protein